MNTDNYLVLYRIMNDLYHNQDTGMLSRMYESGTLSKIDDFVNLREEEVQALIEYTRTDNLDTIASIFKIKPKKEKEGKNYEQ